MYKVSEKEKYWCIGKLNRVLKDNSTSSVTSILIPPF